MEKLKRKSFIKKMVVIMGIVTTVLLTTTILLYICVRSETFNKVDYQTVTVTIDNGEESYKSALRGGHSVVVNVNYNGKEYSLQNVTQMYKYSLNQKITAYLSDGEMYVDVNSIRSDSIIAKIYFVSLASFSLSICVFIGFFVTYRSKRKENSL